MMLKPDTYTLAAIALIFLLSACAIKPAMEKSESPSASDTPELSAGEELAANYAKYVQVTVQPDDMGYLYAVVYNPTNVTFTNVYVLVVHFNAETHQPDRQSIPLLVAASLEPRQRAQLKLEGVQVYSKADLQLYRVIVDRAELAK